MASKKKKLLSKKIKKNKGLQPKGQYGVVLEGYVLKVRYGTDHKPKNSKYDLPSELNKISGRNVSIKSTKSNRIYCGSVFNFLSSFFLEMVVIKYSLSGSKRIQVEQYYLFNDLDSFFITLRSSIDFSKLEELDRLVKGLEYPFTAEERRRCHTMSRLIVKNPFCGFSVACKLSSGNKRIHCELSLKELVSRLTPENLPNNLEIPE
jgi:hypothetical protein